MKRQRLLLSFFIAIFFLSGMVTSVSATEIDEDYMLIKQKMGLLGFEVDKVTKEKDRDYLVNVRGYKQKTRGVTLKGSFHTFTTQVSIIGDGDITGSDKEKVGLIGDFGLLIKDKVILEDAGFIINAGHLPSGITIQ